MPKANENKCVHIYISTTQCDEANGSILRPFSSLEEASDYLESLNPQSDVEIRIIGNKGKYINHSVVWKYYNATYSTKIVGYPESSYAEFQASDDNPPYEPFFKFVASNGERTNIIFERIIVSNYVSRAINISGDRENRVSGWNGNNAVLDCKFLGIGNARMQDRPMVYSAIGFSNSRDNTIEECEFIDIENSNSGGYPQDSISTMSSSISTEDLPIIGIYLAHNSYNNIITDNSFNNIKGDCIRIRDYSNNNIIVNNYFYKSGWKAICTMWYCNRRFQKCTKMKSECPSYENVFQDNIVLGNWLCGYPNLFMDLQKAQVFNCMRMNPNHQVRIRIENNTLSECE